MPKKLDLTGKRFGRLTAVRPIKGSSRYQTWECRCDCGNVIAVDTKHLRLGTTTSCGCVEHSQIPGEKVKRARRGHPKADITGRKYGRLTAIAPTDEVGRGGSVIWRCRCECGNEVFVTVAELNKGNCKSCGCLKEQYQELIHDRLHLVDGTCVEWLAGRRQRVDNASGYKGIFKKKNGKYSVTIGFKKKIYYLGTYENYSDALEARRKGEELIHRGFLKAYNMWNEKAEKEPGWAQRHPFYFEVEKSNGDLIIHNCMEEK